MGTISLRKVELSEFSDIEEETPRSEPEFDPTNLIRSRVSVKRLNLE
jgi:hypothetical protein